MSVLSSRNDVENRTPNDQAAEQAVLGAVLLDGSCLAEVRQVISDPDQFYHPAHAVIFRAMCSIADRPAPVDEVTLRAELVRVGKINTVGGMQYLGELTDTTPSVANVRAHATIVRERADERAVIVLANEVIARLREPPKKGMKDDALSDARALLNKALARTVDARKRGPQSYAAVASTFIKEVEQRMASDRLPGTPTGIYEIDELTGGWRGGQVVVCGARPAMGKTAYAMLACETAANDGAVLMISQEMGAVELFARSAGRRSQLDSSKLKLGRIDQDEMRMLYAACQGLSKLPVEIDDTPGMSLLDVATSAARTKAKYGSLALIVVDYVQLMLGDESGTREQAIGQISRGLKRLAKELNVPILVLSQLNRELEKREDKRPKPSDLRDSGSIEQDADIIFFMYRDWVYHPESADKSEVEFIFAKQRNGETGTVKARWSGQYMSFESLTAGERQQEQELEL